MLPVIRLAAADDEFQFPVIHFSPAPLRITLCMGVKSAENLRMKIAAEKIQPILCIHIAKLAAKRRNFVKIYENSIAECKWDRQATFDLEYKMETLGRV